MDISMDTSFLHIFNLTYVLNGVCFNNFCHMNNFFELIRN